MSDLIQIQNVSKSYWRDSFEIPVLNNLSLDVKQGEFMALMAPSGSGKTTICKRILNVLKI